MNANPSPFACALRALLFCNPKMSLNDWVYYLNPWYAQKDSDGKLTGARKIPEPPGDVFEEASEEQVQAWREDLAKNWVPCYTIGEGVSPEDIEAWLADKKMPSPGDLNSILSYFIYFQRTPEMDVALAQFDVVLNQYAGNATPLGPEYVFFRFNAGSIGARIFMEHYGVVRSLIHVPREKWEQVSFEISAVLKSHT